MSDLERQFEKMGAKVTVESEDDVFQRRLANLPSKLQRRAIRSSSPFSVDVRNVRKGQEFYITLGDKAQAQVVHVDPKLRHLVLQVKNDERSSKFLCGHDEREWFAAAIPESSHVTSVKSAMESLKPEVVLEAEQKAGLRARQKNKRHTTARHRQGEWFFIPDDRFTLQKTDFILRNEPLIRGRGKPHLAEELVRNGGEPVYVFGSNVISPSAYRELQIRDPRSASHYQLLRRNPEVWVRGKIRHPDHKTLVLRGWHRVVSNTETRARAMQHLAFID